MPDDGPQAATEPVSAPRARRKPARSAAAANEPFGGAAEGVSLDDPRVVQILAAEHGSLVAARSLAYNEAFTRGGMFLAFLSFSFVGVALVAQVLPVGREVLFVTALVLAFDLVVGLTTYGRVIATSYEDYLAVYGMARVRHAYGEIAPVVLPYFTTSVNDDLTGVMISYGNPPTTGGGAVVYQLTTSGGMMALIVAMIAGVLALVVALIVGAGVGLAFGLGAVAAVATLVVLAALTVRYYKAVQASLPVAFPSAAAADRA